MFVCILKLYKSLYIVDENTNDIICEFDKQLSNINVISIKYTTNIE